MPAAIADIFRRAAELNRQDPRRQGNVLSVEAGCRMIVAGDVHGNRSALAAMIRFADLARCPESRLVLQEIIHGPPDPATRQDRSIEQLLRAARLKIERPLQVLFVLGNHDLAQITGNEITKDGRGVCKAFLAGVQYCLGDGSLEAMAAAREFLMSIPLAIRCPGGVLISHSLPPPKRMKLAGTEILHRPIGTEDLRRGGAVYEWTWGRGHTAGQLDQLAGELGVQFFVLGHQHVEDGWRRVSPRGVTLASDHDHGCVLCFSSDEPLDAETLADHVRPIAGLGTRK